LHLVQRDQVWNTFWNTQTKNGATILALARVAGSADGILLWPAAFLHAAIAVAIVVGWRRGGKRRPSTRME
jgi:hypothetical protein